MQSVPTKPAPPMHLFASLIRRSIQNGNPGDKVCKVKLSALDVPGLNEQFQQRLRFHYPTFVVASHEFEMRDDGNGYVVVYRRL